MSLIKWTVGRPSASSPRVPIQIVNVKPNHDLLVRFLGNPSCTLVHWEGSRTLPCVQHVAECPFCRNRKEKITCGYAAAQMWEPNVNGERTWISIVIALTDFALEALYDKQLRGHVYKLYRDNDSKRSKLHAKHYEHKPLGLSAEFEPMAIVERGWAPYLATFQPIDTLPKEPPALAQPEDVNAVKAKIRTLFGVNLTDQEAEQHRKGGAQ